MSFPDVNPQEPKPFEPPYDDPDEDYEAMHSYYSDVFGIHELQTGLLNYDGAGYIIDMLAQLKWKHLNS